MKRETIAVIEDEPTIAGALVQRLRKEGFAVEHATDGPSGVELCERLRPDAVILDVMLPGFDGIEVCRRIQAERAVPVIMLTALDDETDKLVGLGVGADDYVTKPFSPRELVARLKALLRRVDRGTRTPEPIQRGDLRVDPRRRVVDLRGEEVHLTPTEFDLIHTFISSPGTVYSRAALMELIWGDEDPLGSRTVDSHIRSIRRKLGSEIIRTVHGVGYALAEETW